MSQNSPLPDSAFWHAYQGRASGLLNWEDVDALWPLLTAQPDNWFVYDLDKDVPTALSTPAEFIAFLPQAKSLVNERRDRSHSGAVYLDNRETPRFIKVFDPTNMGTSCGGDHEMILPRYILSKIQPSPRPAPAPKKKSFLGRLVLRS